MEVSKVITDAFNGNEKTGIITASDFHQLKISAMNELNIDFEYLIRSKVLSFCLPETPLIYPETKDEALSLWEGSATGNIQGIDRHNNKIKEICDNISSELKYETTCSLYFSKENSFSFSKHYDEWEGVAIQIEGVKNYMIYKNEKTDDFDSYTLNEREWLKISPEDLHSVTTSDFSVHLNFACHKKYAI